MPHVLKLNLLLATAVLVSGCTTLSSVPSRMRSLVSRTPDSDDPLTTTGAVSDEYKAAKRELKNADQTMLKFADWCEQRGEFLEAKQRYQDVLNDNANSVEARLGLARVEFATGRKDAAEAILQATAKKHPDNAQVWLQIGQLHTDRKEWGAATESLKKAVALAPSDQASQYALGLSLARSERYDEAVEHLRIAVGESAAYYNIGFLLSEAGRNEEAKHWLQRSLGSQPNEQTRAMAVQMMAEIGRSSNALPQIVAAAPPRSRVDMSATTYEAYREAPKNWKTSVGPAGVAAVQPETVATPAIVVSPIVQQTAYESSPTNGQVQTATSQFSSATGSLSSAEAPMWRGPGHSGSCVEPECSCGRFCQRRCDAADVGGESLEAVLLDSFAAAELSLPLAAHRTTQVSEELKRGHPPFPVISLLRYKPWMRDNLAPV